jgi:PKD repeat protein
MNKFIKFFLAFILIIPGLLIAQTNNIKSIESVPVANFSAIDTAVCSPAILIESFTDLSTNSPTKWKWYFPGATPDTSTLKNPTNILYSGSGCYNVTLVASNSSGSDSVTKNNFICIYPPPVITITNNRICSGSTDSAIATVSNGYHWSNGSSIDSIIVRPPSSITYTLQATNGICSFDTTITIIVDTMPNVRFTGDTSICAGDTATIHVSGGKGIVSYIWSTGSTADSIFLDTTVTGLYHYYVTVAKGACIKDSVMIGIDVQTCTGIENYSDPVGIDIFPIPVNKELSIIMDNPLKQDGILEVDDLTGRQIQKEILKANQTRLVLDVSSLASAVYFLKIQTEGGIVVKKFVKD